jgi:hypothetical protein
MIEIVCIIAENNEGESWIEKVCSDKNEAQLDIEFLKNKSITIPEIDSIFFIDLGLSFQERETLINKIIEFKRIAEIEKVTYKIEYHYLHDDSQQDDDADDKITIKVIDVSELNYSKHYIHTVVEYNEASIGEDYSKIYKISLPGVSPIGTIDTISLKDFIIVEREKGFQYPKNKSNKKIVHNEKWLFIRRPGE